MRIVDIMPILGDIRIADIPMLSEIKSKISRIYLK